MKNLNRKQQNKQKPNYPVTLYLKNLRLLRRQIAEQEDKPPFLIFSDATLHEMARLKPQTLNQLLDISGVGQHKLQQYGTLFLGVLIGEIS